MQVNQKPRFRIEDVATLLAARWPNAVTTLEKLVEGEDSQAFWFESADKKYVFRINKSDYGFKKDGYAYEHFASKKVPISRVYDTGSLDDDHAYCISEFIVGPTLQDLDRSAVTQVLPATLEMQRNIAGIDIATTAGYGEFDLSGNGKSSSWQEWLLTHISAPEFDWDAIISDGLIERSFLSKVFDSFRKLVDQVPNERQLVHGDFGSNNLITRNGKVVAVLDWDAASYGDWLFDVAGAYYWRNHLLCMGLAADYYEQELHGLPNYHARINCYQLRATLIEMYVQAQRAEHKKLDYHIRRCQELLDTIS